MIEVQQPALNDSASMNQLSALINNTASQYIDQNVQKGTNIVTGRKELKQEEINYTLASAVANLVNAKAQDNATVDVNPVDCVDMERIGVDQLNASLSIPNVTDELKQIIPPTLVTVPSTNMTFRPEGTLMMNGVQVANYDPTKLDKSILLGATTHLNGVTIPYLGYDIKVRPFDTELGETIITLTGYEGLVYDDEQSVPLTGTEVYRYEFRSNAVSGKTGTIIAVPAYNKYVDHYAPYAFTTRTSGVMTAGISRSLRSKDLMISLNPSAGTLLNSVEDDLRFALHIAAANAVVYVTPIIPSKEVLVRVLNTLAKDGSAYMSALYNVYNATK